MQAGGHGKSRLPVEYVVPGGWKLSGECRFLLDTFTVPKLFYRQSFRVLAYLMRGRALAQYCEWNGVVRRVTRCEVFPDDG